MAVGGAVLAELSRQRARRLPRSHRARNVSGLTGAGGARWQEANGAGPSPNVTGPLDARPLPRLSGSRLAPVRRL